MLLVPSAHLLSLLAMFSSRTRAVSSYHTYNLGLYYNYIVYYGNNFFSTFTASPNIEFGQEYFEGVAIKAGENIKLKVTIAGRPTPKIKWFRNDVELTKKMVDITATAGLSTLFIRDADRSHRGVYTVEARNSCGMKTEQIKVKVYGMHLNFPTQIFTFVYSCLFIATNYCDILRYTC